jgi:excisionase family DNA binding protein
VQVAQIERKGTMKTKTLLDGRTYYSSKDLARMFSVNESTIKRWADSGKLRCFRTVGNHRRFPMDVVYEFIARYHMELGLPHDVFKESFPE